MSDLSTAARSVSPDPIQLGHFLLRRIIASLREEDDPHGGITIGISAHIHPGMSILIPGNLEREKQVEFSGRVLDVIEPLSDIVNEIVEIFSDGSVEVRDWPEAPA